MRFVPVVLTIASTSAPAIATPALYNHADRHYWEHWHGYQRQRRDNRILLHGRPSWIRGGPGHNPCLSLERYRRFWDAMRDRLQEFALTLHPDKTRLIEFGRRAASRHAQRGLAKPETFNFLGLPSSAENPAKDAFS